MKVSPHDSPNLYKIMNRWYIYDNQVTDTYGFDISWLPTEAYRYVTPHISQALTGFSTVRLKAGPYVGALPLKNGDTLYIIPRVGRESYSRMLFVVEGLEDAVRKEFEQFVKLGHEKSGNTPWSILLARPFVDKLRLIEKESLVTDRIPVLRRLRYIKGKVRIADSLTSWMRKEEYPIHTFLRERTVLNLENRLLSTASAILLRTEILDKVQREVATRWAKLGRGRSITSYELGKIGAGLKSHKYTGSRSYYVPALVMAKLIISQAGLNLDDVNSVQGESLVTNIADLFEKYVRTLVGKLLSPKGYLVEKKKSHSPTLFIDGTCELKPDIVISQRGIVKLVVDAKYKPRSTIDTPDYYQMSIYLDNFGVDVGLLVLPNPSQSEYDLVKRETLKGKRIFELRLPLGDWDKSEDALAETINDLV